ncbi:hypothetical protein COCNU_01G016850 [Cocos nucifera]|uniref:Uncharacterized protein n=1 Tax=Cocos nucifera TaxID=13894 RepID=A0A8K0HWF1_COCNU|nr:hypothetical protein COCNU_01G016850 [Cocos nucifera]
MAAKPVESPVAPASIPRAAAQDPGVEFSGEEAEEEKEREEREVKRRRTCPPVALRSNSSAAAAAVEEVEDEEARVSGREGFSFSFDAGGIAPIETTPKFGSFNCLADPLALGAAKESEEKAKNGKEEGEEVKNESKTAS